MGNLEYLESIGVTDPETQQRCLETMEKYGDNHWWEPGICPRIFAYHQLHEDIMLCERFSRFHEATELLLGRPVFTHEFGMCVDQLRQEAKKAMEQ